MHKNVSKFKPTHVAYIDETNHNVGRYRGVASISLSLEHAKQATLQIEEIWRDSNIREFKWTKVRSAQYRFIALKLIDCVLDWIECNQVRVDVITWDTEDSRHNIRNRSDIRNLRRMYYFLVRNVLGKRWPNSCIWELRPDDSSFQASSHLRYLGDPEELNEDARGVKVSQVIDKKSCEEPLVQVADFFAGLGAYSRNSFQTYELWAELRAGSEGMSEVPSLSNSAKERCEVMAYLQHRCTELKLRVSLAHARGFKTMDARSPLNFWWYEPQGEYDKAPTWH